MCVKVCKSFVYGGNTVLESSVYCEKMPHRRFCLSTLRIACFRLLVIVEDDFFPSAWMTCFHLFVDARIAILLTTNNMSHQSVDSLHPISNEGLQQLF